MCLCGALSLKGLQVICCYLCLCDECDQQVCIAMLILVLVIKIQMTVFGNSRVGCWVMHVLPSGC